MSKKSEFTDTEIRSIKQKINEKSDRGIKFAVLSTPLTALIGIYLPGKRGRKTMIERMDFHEAYLQYIIIFLSILLISWVGITYLNNKAFSKRRKFLRKKIITTSVKRKSRSNFKSYDNILITELEGKLNNINIYKEESSQLKVGDKINIEYEEQTNAILKIKKVV